MSAPSVFLCYTHENREHNEWVRSLAANLLGNGVDVTADFYDLRGGFSVTRFMDTVVDKDKVVIICTPEYKLRADGEIGGAGAEFAKVKAQLVAGTVDGRIIPVLRNGGRATAIPTAISHLLSIDMTNLTYYEDKFDELLRAIYDEPTVRKPPIGRRPAF